MGKIKMINREAKSAVSALIKNTIINVARLNIEFEGSLEVEALICFTDEQTRDQFTVGVHERICKEAPALEESSSLHQISNVSSSTIIRPEDLINTKIVQVGEQPDTSQRSDDGNDEVILPGPPTNNFNSLKRNRFSGRKNLIQSDSVSHEERFNPYDDDELEDMEEDEEFEDFEKERIEKEEMDEEDEGITSYEPPVSHKNAFSNVKSLRNRRFLLSQTPPQPRYPCIICDVTLLTVQSFQKHTRDVHRLHSCHICFCNFNSAKRLQEHTMTAHNSLSNRLSFQYDRQRPVNSSQHVCNLCGRCFIKRQAWVLHMRQHQIQLTRPDLDEDDELECARCGLFFPDEEQYIDHMMRTHQNNLATSNEGGTASTTPRIMSKMPYVNSAQTMQAVTRQPYCNKCEIRFNDVSALRNHIRLVHAQPERFHCNVCIIAAGSGVMPPIFSCKEALSEHMESSHAAPMEHFCIQCNTGFSSNDEYVIHVTTRHHRGQTDSQSPPPDNSSSTHQDNKLNSFKNVTQQQSSSKFTVRPGMFGCEKCQKNFPNKEQLESHFSEEHQTQLSYYCAQCREGFFDRNDYVVHIKLHAEQTVGVRAQPLSNEGSYGDREPKKDSDPNDSDFSEIDDDEIFNQMHTPCFRCGKCEEIFDLRPQLERHFRSDHGVPMLFLCNVRSCNRGFDSKNSYLLHIKSHAENKIIERHYQTSVSGPSSQRRIPSAATGKSPMASNLKQNSQLHKNAILFNQGGHKHPRHGRGYESQHKRRRYSKDSESDSGSFKNSISDSEDSYQEEEISNQPRRAAENLDSTSSEENDFDQQVFKCGSCNVKYYERSLLDAHFRRSHQITAPNGSSQFYCAECQSAYAQINDYVMHVKTHAEKKIDQKDEAHNRFELSNQSKRSSSTHENRMPAATSTPDVVKETLKVENSNKDAEQCNNGSSNSENQQFKCGHCQLIASSRSLLEDHVSQIHKLQMDYFCNSCNLGYGNMNDYVLHVSSHATTKSMGGSTTDAFTVPTSSFSSSTNIKDDRLNNRDIKSPFKDNILKKESTNTRKFHIKDGSESRTINSNADDNENKLKQEMNSVSNQSFPEENVNIHSSFRCNSCRRSFLTRRLLQDHFDKHHGPMLNLCAECNEAFDNTGDYLHHIQSHAEKSIKLKVSTSSSKSLSSSTSSTAAIAAVAAAQALIAKKNKQESQNTSEAQVDENTTQQSMPAKAHFKCSKCPKRFYQRLKLDAHMSRDHKVTQIMFCTDCSEAFASKADYMSHVQEHAEKNASQKSEVSATSGPAHKLRAQVTSLQGNKSPRHPNIKPEKGTDPGSSKDINLSLCRENETSPHHTTSPSLSVGVHSENDRIGVSQVEPDTEPDSTLDSKSDPDSLRNEN